LNLLIVEDVTVKDHNSGTEMDDVERSINMPIILDQLYNLIVCKDCGIGMPIDWIVGHLRENHGIKTTIMDVVRFLNMMKPSMTSTEAKEWIKSTWAARAVQNVPVKKGYACNECQYSSKRMKSMRDHFSGSHRGLKASKNVKKCKVQLPFKGGLQKYIQIEEDDDLEMNSHGDSEWKMALELEFEESMKRHGSTSNDHDDLRLMDAFIAKIRWDVCVKGMNMDELVRLAAAPTKKDDLHKIILCGRQYIEKCCNNLNGGNMIVRRLMMSCGYISMNKCYSDV
jgi:hypothetical protein